MDILKFLGFIQRKFEHFVPCPTFIQGPTFIGFAKVSRPLCLIPALRLFQTQEYLKIRKETPMTTKWMLEIETLICESKSTLFTDSFSQSDANC